MDIVMVRLVQIGKEVKEYEISDNPTVAGLLNKANVSYKPGTITVNHQAVETITQLDDGDIVYIGDALKGNAPFTVKLIRLGTPDAIPEIPVESGVTIKGVIDSQPASEVAKYYNPENGAEIYEYRVNGEMMTGSAVIPTPSDPTVAVRIIMGTKTKGNACKNPTVKTTKKKVVKKPSSCKGMCSK